MAKRKPKRKKKPKPRHETVPLTQVLDGIELPADAPPQMMVDADVDLEIAPLVREMNRRAFVTFGSCSGMAGRTPISIWVVPASARWPETRRALEQPQSLQGLLKWTRADLNRRLRDFQSWRAHLLRLHMCMPAGI